MADWRSFRFVHRIRYFAQRASLLFLTISSRPNSSAGCEKIRTKRNLRSGDPSSLLIWRRKERTFPGKENA